MVIAKSVSLEDQQLLCSEGRKRGVASLILDSYGHLSSGPEVHFNPLDGPEAFLRVLEAVMQRDHRSCIG